MGAHRSRRAGAPGPGPDRTRPINSSAGISSRDSRRFGLSAARSKTCPSRSRRSSAVKRGCDDARRLIRKPRRMVTLIGTGGTGKTRLMLEAAQRMEERYPDGVNWPSLRGPPSWSRRVEVVRALGGREQPGSVRSAARSISSGTSSSSLLLDNCEHVVGAAADLASRILTNCPDVTILATSREALGIDGEHVYQVPSLGLVRGERTGDARLEARPDQFRAIATAGAVRLFVDRATAVVPELSSRMRTPRPSPRSASASTGSRWPSNSPPLESRSCRSTTSSVALATRSGFSLAAVARRSRDNRRSRPSSTGAGTCWWTRTADCFDDSRSSPAVGRSRRHRRSAVTRVTT